MCASQALTGIDARRSGSAPASASVEVVVGGLGGGQPEADAVRRDRLRPDGAGVLGRPEPRDDLTGEVGRAALQHLLGDVLEPHDLARRAACDVDELVWSADDALPPSPVSTRKV